MDTNLLEVRDLHKRFGDNEVLRGITLSIKQGEVVSIIGPSGSGKSTFLRCMTLLEHADAGTALVDGETMFDMRDGKLCYAAKETLTEIRLKLGLVFQSFHLFPHLSVLHNITEPLTSVQKMEKHKAEETARALLDKMGLCDKEDAYPCELSGGQCQRVAIARATALRPKLLFFDEPTSALDPELTQEIVKIIRLLAQEQLTMVVVTHDIPFARDVSDRIIFMENGEIIEEGPTSQLFTSPQKERTRTYLGI